MIEKLLLAPSPPPPPSESRLIPALPDDLAILCLARIPRFHHPLLATVSRAWRAALCSAFFFSTRLELCAAQHFLLINVRTPTGQSRWHLLDRMRRNTSSPLIPLPKPPLPDTFGCAAVTLGHSLFLLGGSINDTPSSSVQIYDARFNCWSLGVPMLASREFAAAGAIAGRIYAVGGCHDSNDFWAEEFDTKKEEWKQVPSPLAIREKWMHGNVVIGGKLFAVADRGGVIFDPSVAMSETEGTRAWSVVPTSLDLGWRGRAAAVGEVLYTYDFLGKIKGYDLVTDEWKTVEGVDKELPKFLHGSTLSSLGAMLCLVWEEWRRSEEMEIICAGVSVTRTNNGGLQGTIEWSETIAMAIPRSSSIAHCISLEF